jgi:uncharacterized protein (DUF2384 family)
MHSLPPKKGSRMTRVCSPKKLSADAQERAERDAEIRALAKDTFEAIQEARSKMSAEQRDLADREADAIITDAISRASHRRQRA